MKKAGTMLIGLAALGAAGAYAWNRLLTPSAREGILKAASTIADSFETVRKQAEDMVGTYGEDDLISANKQKTEKQWESLSL